MTGVSLAARARLFIGLALLAVMSVWALLAVRDARQCGEGHDPNVFVSLFVVGPLLWLVALVLLAWGSERPWGWLRVAGLVVAAVGFMLMFTQAENCLA